MENKPMSTLIKAHSQGLGCNIEHVVITMKSRLDNSTAASSRPLKKDTLDVRPGLQMDLMNKKNILNYTFIKLHSVRQPLNKKSKPALAADTM